MLDSEPLEEAPTLGSPALGSPDEGSPDEGSPDEGGFVVVGPDEEVPNAGVVKERGTLASGAANAVSWVERLDDDAVGNDAEASGETLSGRGAPKVAIAGGWGTPAGELIASMLGDGKPAAKGFAGIIGGGAKDCVGLESEVGDDSGGGAIESGDRVSLGACSSVSLGAFSSVSLGAFSSVGESNLALGIIPSGRLDRIREASNRGGSLNDLAGGIAEGSSKANGTVWDASLVSYCCCAGCTSGNAVEVSSSKAAFCTAMGDTTCSA
jgi:hypothetical protein